MKRSAVAVLITIPTAATAMIVQPCVGSGEFKRVIASHASEPIATRSSTALANAATIEARRNP